VTGAEDVLFGPQSSAQSPLWTPDGRAILFIANRAGPFMYWLQRMANGQPVGQPELMKSDIGQSVPLGFGSDGSLFYGNSTSLSDVYVATIDVASGATVSAPALVADRSVGRNGMPDWSADGQSLVYRTGGTSLSFASGDGVTIRHVTPRLAWFLWPRWAPDGRSILSHAQSTDRQEGLFTIDPETGQATEVVAGSGNGQHAAWARDGRAIFYSSRVDRGDRLVERNLGTGKEREIYRPDSPAYIRDLAVSPDNRQVAFWVVDTAAPRSAVLTIAVPAAGTHRALVSVRDPDAVYEFAGIAWTPDGDRLVYVKSRTQPEQRSELWVVPAAGGEPRKCDLKVDGLRNLALNPDGRRVAFTAGIPTGEVWMLENFLPAGASRVVR